MTVKRKCQEREKEKRSKIPFSSRIKRSLYIKLDVLSFCKNYQKPPALRPPGGLFTRMHALRASSTSSVKKNVLYSHNMKNETNEIK